MAAEKEATYNGNDMPYMTDKEATYTGKEMHYMADMGASYTGTEMPYMTVDKETTYTWNENALYGCRKGSHLHWE